MSKKKKAKKKKMRHMRTKKNIPKATLINFVLDESGSMATCKAATISGFNEYLASLQQNKTTDFLFTFVKFDSTKVEVVCRAEPVDRVKPLTEENYRPGECTPLYDAVAKTIRTTTEDLLSLKDLLRLKPAVLCVIMTDGQENASREYTRDSIFQFIKAKEKAGWTFVYMGANQDAWAVGASIGIPAGNTMKFDTSKTPAVFRTMSTNTAQYASHGSCQTVDFFQDKSEQVTDDPA